jgi:hypothetical protein
MLDIVVLLLAIADMFLDLANEHDRKYYYWADHKATAKYQNWVTTLGFRISRSIIPGDYGKIGDDLGPFGTIWAPTGRSRVRVGVPLYERVLGKVSTPTAIAALFQRIARETPGIASVSQFFVDYDPQGRSLSLSGEAKTAYGETIVLENEELIL